MRLRKRKLHAPALSRPRHVHRPLILEALRRNADSLQRRIRPHYIEALVDSILIYEPDAEAFEAMEPRDQLAVLVLHGLHVCRDISSEDKERSLEFEAFSEDFHRMRTDEARRRRIREYIEQTEDDPKKRRDDIAATEEFLDYGVMVERNTRAKESRAAAIEVALGFIGGALNELTNPDKIGDQPFPRVLLDGELDTQLAQYLESEHRWQNRCAALRALVTLFVNLHGLGQFGAANTDVLRTITSLLANPRENPWIQIAAAPILQVLPPDERFGRLYRRLVLDSDIRSNTDFLVRRKLVELSFDYLRFDQFSSLITSLVAAGDPSEHVRMGIASTVARIGSVTAFVLLKNLLVHESELPKPSARVRASCVIAASQTVLDAHTDDVATVADEALGLLLAMLPLEKDRLVLETMGDEAVEISRPLLERDLREPVCEIRDMFLERRTDQSLDASSHEFLSSAAEKLELLLSPIFDRWASHLASEAVAIRPGTSKTIDLTRGPSDLPPLPHNPTWLGRILADLSRRDWGLSVRRRGNKLTMWRGDHFQRRIWRMLHEVTHPAPNKRQAFPHTIGRKQRGNLRAHPGSMDEVTATTVPGERVVIDTEGSWGRHLPLVDDLLDLPLFGGREVTLFSSHGTVRLTAPTGFLTRLKNRLKLSYRYRKLSLLRISSLRANEPQERRRYLEAVGRDYGINCIYEPYSYQERPTPALPSPYVTTLMPRSTLAASIIAMVPFWGEFRHWLDEKLPYFLDASGNSQTALAIFAGALTSFLFAESYYKRTTITHSRDRVPLSIGGWGTRGKSGTERIKAGLFHGLGFHTFTKTTGCEAMFINSLPGQSSLEVFIYRPYDKATIWEQKSMIELASNVGAEVFLWECMALNPTYVRLLQHVWMRDDLVTLTNAFPDHEDIQGPAGHNVARVITNFIPPNRTLFTTETNFLPMFRDRCTEMNTELVAVSPRDADLIAQDILELFPYQEHPRNIALVARMAEHLDIEITMAMVMMAEHVVPDLGVLKTYPTVRLRGRVFSFVNGMSANERAGCLNNWRRMGLDKLSLEGEPERSVITVVNNRDDRISRSEVFARIMVEDLVVDKHVLIGTNLRGLTGFIDDALDRFVSTLEVVGGDGESSLSPEKRLAGHMARLRIPAPSIPALMARLRIHATGGGLVIGSEFLPQLEHRLRELLESSESASLDVNDIRESLQNDKGLVELVQQALVPPSNMGERDNDESEVPEIMAPATIEDITDHFFFILARTIVHARLAVRAAGASKNGAQEFHETFWETYKVLFHELLDVVENSGATGDQVIARCIAAATPGTQITLLGIQNIKGTGLDFVYRWVALDKVVSSLNALMSPDQSKRENAMRDLGSFGDHGMVDSGLARIVLQRMQIEHLGSQEEAQLERVRERVQRVYQERLAKLEHVGGSTFTDSVFNWLEGWFDNLDSIRRFRQSKRVNREIVNHRISLAQAAIEMRNIYARQKGGWLAKLIKARKK